MVIICIIKDCGKVKTKNGPPFHQFPSNPSKREAWKNSIEQGIGYRSGCVISDYMSVCSEHFHETDYSCGNRLKPTAVPSRFVNVAGVSSPARKRAKTTSRNHFKILFDY